MRPYNNKPLLLTFDEKTMGFKYQIRNDGLYFLTFATTDWIDVFTRKELADQIITSLKYCQKDKGLQIFAWCLMPSHIHLLASAGMNGDLSAIMRDLKKFTSKKIIETIKIIPQSLENGCPIDLNLQDGLIRGLPIKNSGRNSLGAMAISI